MDELGFMESEAFIFQAEVMKCLDGDIPVLGVVRSRQTDFLDAVRQHEKVTLLDVTKENRGHIVENIRRTFGVRNKISMELSRVKKRLSIDGK